MGFHPSPTAVFPPRFEPGGITPPGTSPVPLPFLMETRTGVPLHPHGCFILPGQEEALDKKPPLLRSNAERDESRGPTPAQMIRVPRRCPGQIQAVARLEQEYFLVDTALYPFLSPDPSCWPGRTVCSASPVGQAGQQFDDHYHSAPSPQRRAGRFMAGRRSADVHPSASPAEDHAPTTKSGLQGQVRAGSLL